jgi:hypothetical protein
MSAHDVPADEPMMEHMLEKCMETEHRMNAHRWTYPTTTQTQPQIRFVRLVSSHPTRGDFRREQVIALSAIRRIEEGPFGIRMEVAGQREPINLELDEYLDLQHRLESTGMMVTLGGAHNE